MSRQGENSPVELVFRHSTGPSLLAWRTGKLATADGCVLLIGEAGGRTLPVFHTDSASWDDAEQTLTYDGTTYRLGDEVRLPGGSAGKADEANTAGLDDLPDCGDVELFLVNATAPRP